MGNLQDSECFVDGCGRKAMYKKDRLCQMHYFRRMRNGHFDLKDYREPGAPRPRKDKYFDDRGYVIVHAAGHPLAGVRGLAREHRIIYHDQINSNPTECELCKAPVNWETVHIDHADNNTSNNDKNNLRALCRACNVMRGHSKESFSKYILEIDGIRMDSAAWARVSGVEISGPQILRRFKSGMSARDAVFLPRKTHQNTRTKKPKPKYDAMRGITPGDFDKLRAELPCNKEKTA